MLLSNLCFSGNNEFDDRALDSLIAKENAETSGKEKLRIIREICLNHYNIDTIYKYAQIASVIAKSLGNEKEIAFAYSLFSWCDYHKGDYSKSLGWSYMVLGRCEKFNEPYFKARCYKQLAYTYYGLSDFYNADRFCRESLRVFDSLQVDMEVASAYRTLGTFCMEYGFFDMGAVYIRKAYQIDFQKYEEGAAEDLMYFGYYDYLYHFTDPDKYRSYLFSSVHWYQRALANLKNRPAVMLKSRIIERIALAYCEASQLKILKPELREEYLDSCRKYSEICRFYAEKTASEEKKFLAGYTSAIYFLLKKDIPHAEKEIEYLVSFMENNPVRQLRFGLYYYKVMIMYSRLINDYKAEMEYIDLLIISNLKRYNFDLASKVGRIQAKEDFDKSEYAKKLDFERNKALFDQKLREKEIINKYLLLIVLVFAAVVIYIWVVFYEQTKINELLKQQSENINSQNVMLNRQKEEFLSLRKEFLAEELQLQAKKKKFIKLNQRLHYSLFRAQEIQTALIPSKEILEDCFGESLVYFKPRQVVSGDFYWALKTPEIRVLVTADCTGHGISGGFLSMLGISSLNDIVTHRDLSNTDSLAADILEDMRQKIITSLHQKEDSSVQNDTIDMSICIFGKQEGELQYAGANRPLWISGKNGIRCIEPDGFSTGMDFNFCGKFTNNIVKYEKGETVYTFSDGITDQFGGKTGKMKFGEKRLKKLLEMIFADDFQTQYQEIEETMFYWTTTDISGDSTAEVYMRQVDDQLLIGIKV